MPSIIVESSLILVSYHIISQMATLYNRLSLWDLLHLKIPQVDNFVSLFYMLYLVQNNIHGHLDFIVYQSDLLINPYFYS
jgi:hypothetical protein